MANDEHATDADAAREHHADSHIHVPPNSWSPINVALALTMCFIGLLAATWVWIVGVVWLIASLAAWYRGARNEYNELPESLGEH